MATIEKYTGKDGITYRITVYAGFDTQGKRIRMGGGSAKAKIDMVA